MEQLLFGLLAAALGAALAVQLWRGRGAGRRRAATRARFFDACAGHLGGSRITIAPTGFPRLGGRYRGLPVDLQAVPDTLTFRKLPALWVLVTLPGPLPVRSTFDLMIRPTGVEPFSNFNRLPDQIDAPEGFPPDCAVRTDAPLALPDEALLRRHLGLFAAARVKELVISPKGLRLVWLAEEAHRGRYLLYRDAEMGQTPFPPEQVMPLLDALIALRADILNAELSEERLSA
ncbi:hypothetical protein [Defluviimonas salinarum]|uniref:DUF3137 domain-containing protein n=1 Tax=Defluviimonas salinarum TaxID=2992147 RepID=A0ABT3J750_9RHOB|nr:hypothetical protein [Defluviimonas salinarum]MCW3783249.1 hypothetical protein [Defluviimonas salinarum]